MGLGVVVHGGKCVVNAGTWSPRKWSNGGEGGGELVQGPGESGTRVADGKGDELHPPQVSSEGRQWGSVFRGLLLKLLNASKVSLEADLDDDESALFPFEGVRVRIGGVWEPLA